MRFMHLLPISALALASLTIAPLALADTPPDVVMLKNGGMLRGTIEEMDPQGNVVVALPSGEKRTIAMSEVSYAGPASGAGQPSPAPPPDPVPDPAPPPAPVAPPQGPAQGRFGGTQPLVTVHGVEARLQLRGDGIAFHRQSGSGTGTGSAGGRAVTVSTKVYSEMCAAPCEISMPRGTYTLALSQDGTPVEADPVTINSDGTLEGKYSSRSGIRTAGWVVMVGGSTTGLVLMLSDPGDGVGPSTQTHVGTAVLLVGLVAGAIMAMTSDSADIQFIPAAPVGLSHPSDLRADSGSRFRGYEPGLSLAMAF